MKYLLTNEQMREADAFTIKELGVPALELMERAGLALYQTAKELAGNGKILCVCGSGNNGGDGYVCGRKLLLDGFVVDGFTNNGWLGLATAVVIMAGIMALIYVKVRPVDIEH